jgi:hypothetical protein
MNLADINLNVKGIVFFCLLLLTLGGSACTVAITPAAPTSVPPTDTPSTQAERSSNGVIFSEEQAAEQFPSIGMQVEGTWTPTDADVARLEAALPDFLRTADDPWLEPDPPIWERAPDYTRQYLGMIENGEQVIYANFFCSDHENWQEQIVFVLDGGDCYFQVKYNPQTDEFYDLSVNGQA